MAQLPPHAAAGVAAAAWEEEAEWLDVEDSDIRLDAPAPSTISRPCATAPSHRLHVPEPASAVQDAMRRRLAASPPTSRGRAEAKAPDPDFLLPPWLCALRFLGKDRGWEQPGIKVIKREEELCRAPLVRAIFMGILFDWSLIHRALTIFVLLHCCQVAGVVTSCKPNGLGGLLVTLKDPSAAIAASVHKKVLLESNNAQDISVGCVIVLRKVHVFRPTHKACYLNITKVTKVLRKDCDSPSKPVISSNATERSEGSIDTIMMRLLGHERMIPHNNGMRVTEVSLQHQGISCAQSSLSESTVMSEDRCSAQASNNENLRRPFGSEKMLHISKKLKSDAALPGDNGETASSRIDTADNYVLQRNMGTELAEQLNGQLSSIRELMEHQQRDFIAVNAGSAQPTSNGSLLNPKKVVSVGSAEWTDEQLCQLLL
ncbi:hypothetical protein HU200_015657 [Digitaria exilis]|uniref:Homologous recombination OB-fold protein OB-fold domain-containing protein n=1 Tax=Digitaria exilis TaxID=1010633 RepID=A0A835KHF4_9POAL|nr:hypothetical protein HU200_015657 [Digitaria exilis]